MTNEIEEYLKMKQDISKLNDATPEEWDRATRGWSKASSAITEAVDHPPHYNHGSIETIDYIVDVLGEYEAISYCHGNLLKYTGSRLWKKGNPIEDAEKAAWYLDKMIELMKKTKGVNW